MPLSRSPMLKSGATHSAMPHIHATGESCPLCDEPIPHDRFDEIKARIETRQLARTAEITSRLQEQFAREKGTPLNRHAGKLPYGNCADRQCT